MCDLKFDSIKNVCIWNCTNQVYPVNRKSRLCYSKQSVDKEKRKKVNFFSVYSFQYITKIQTGAEEKK